MANQKELLQRLLNKFGANQETTDAIIGKMFPEEGEGELDDDLVLSLAQDYAKPHLFDSWKNSEHKAITGKAMGDIITRVVKQSNGKLKRSDLENKPLEEILEAYSNVISTPQQNKDLEDMIKALREEKELSETALRKQIEDIKNEYEGKERQGKIQTALKAFLAKQTLTVSPDIALKAVLPSLNERFNLGLDETGNVNLFDKSNPETLARKSKTEFASLDEEISNELNAFNFMAKSKGTPPPNPHTPTPNGNPNPNTQKTLGEKMAEAFPEMA